ncbi:MAG: hypothetical protein ABIP77_02905 [Candidatus Limnocylindrales bacterium]
MATTEAKPGFRLPWSSDRSEPGNAIDATDGESGAPSPETEEIENPTMVDAAPAATTQADVDAQRAAPAPSTLPNANRKPNKFMADLSKAMQAAAESARADALERLGAEAKGHIESIHADSATEATELRKRADDDVAAVREWSKAEIARIREETDERITHRKEALEREIDEHAAAIEARIGRVQARIASYEAEMAVFFERLLAEDDPTHFAAMAESLPEPPPFDTDDMDSAPYQAASIVDISDVPTVHESSWPDEGSPDLFIDHATPDASVAEDPRVSMLGLTTDFAAAEAEAATLTADDDLDDSMPDVADEAIAARLAGLVSDGEAPATDHTSTRIVVVGLVSVASIAGFKRHLTRAAGVHSVGVSSGPDGEFVFTVSHDPLVALRDVVPTLPGFGARITGDGDGELAVTARDPETES